MDTDVTLESAAEALFSKHSGKSAEQAEPDAPEQESQDHADHTQGEEDQGEDQGETEEQTEEQDSEDEAEETPQTPKSVKVADDATVTLNLGDTEKDVTVAELKRGYLRQSDYSRKTQEVSEQRKTFVTQAKQYEDHIQTQLQEVGFLAQTLMQQLVEGDKVTNWDELRLKNPAEYAARQYDKQQKQQLLGRTYKAYQEAQQRKEVVEQEKYQQHLTEQSEQLLTVIPEWIDSGVRKTEQKAVAKFLIEMGVPEDEVSALADARTVAIARMAMLYKQGETNRAKARQQLQKPVPPLQKSNTVRDLNPTRTANKKLMEAAKKTGKDEDFAAALASKYR